MSDSITGRTPHDRANESALPQPGAVSAESLMLSMMQIQHQQDEQAVKFIDALRAAGMTVVLSEYTRGTGMAVLDRSRFGRAMQMIEDRERERAAAHDRAVRLACILPPRGFVMENLSC